MRYAIVESGGKQYRAVEGELIDVDRLAGEAGEEISIERVLMMSDDQGFEVGTPTLAGVEVKAVVVDHVGGPKVVHFKYSPKKRIRVRGGHRQQYTRLKIKFVGKKGEKREMAQPGEAPQQTPVTAEERHTTRKTAGKKAATKKTAAPKRAAKKSAK